VTPWRRRTASENNRNFSADDDYVLKHTVLRLMATVDAFVLVTTDADFSPTIDMIRHSGRLALLAAYERHGHRLSRTLRERADEVLPLQEIALDRDEAEPLQTADNVVSEIERRSVEDTVIELFHRGRRLLQFPLHASEVEIGRRSVRLGHFPHLDVTDFDPDRTVSRRHLRVRETMERQVFLQVRSSCSRGTWMNGNPIFPGETVQVQEGDNIVFGSREDGFGLRLRLPVVVTVREGEIG
jgi:pSer/pThr/pTyr-binding forkhead associated (FHA) protein